MLEDVTATGAEGLGMSREVGRPLPEVALPGFILGESTERRGS